MEEPTIQPYVYSIARKERHAWRFVLGVLGSVALGVGVLMYMLAVDTPRASFPQTVTIARGSSIRTATNELKKHNLVRSPRLLELYITVVEGGRVVSGDYLFEKSAPVTELAHRLTSGRYGESQIRITIPEGSTAKDIARIMDAGLPEFDSDVFLKLAAPKEGFLFPDTYFFFPSVTEVEIVQKLERNFNDQIADLSDELKASPHTLVEIVTMASLIEREAFGDPTEQRTISGILWKRIQKGMALQVDAPFWYLLGKGSSDLTVGDLQYDSRYNTYKYKGLPPGPIGNPGLASITAAVRPIQTDYLFYLHDKDGIVHYAATFDGHIKNKQLYLN